MLYLLFSGLYLKVQDMCIEKILIRKFSVGARQCRAPTRVLDSNLKKILGDAQNRHPQTLPFLCQ